MVDVSKIDKIVSGMERKWGIERLPRLVSEYLQMKFNQQQDLFNRAIESGNQAQVDHIGGGMIRAWETLDKAAHDAGHRPLEETIWTAKHPTTGKTVAIYNGDVSIVEVRDAAEVCFSLEELIKFIPDLVITAFETFPDAKITDIKGFNDEIPF